MRYVYTNNFDCMILFKWSQPGQGSRPVPAASTAEVMSRFTGTESNIGSVLDRCMARHRSWSQYNLCHHTGPSGLRQ